MGFEKSLIAAAFGSASKANRQEKHTPIVASSSRVTDPSLTQLAAISIELPSAAFVSNELSDPAQELVGVKASL
jgi:hypothetical protein